ncbi:sensor histidine kinase [Paenibacillus sp. 1P07SE]|uniref:sensor histidine kinase n=1 Tax=Paenibacillus sp. 1P07SE TaxID=3132209 RepID=UPI0039A57013
MNDLFYSFDQGGKDSGRRLSRLKSGFLPMLGIGMATAIAGQVMIYPFSGDMFRIGLGASTFLLFLMLMNHLSFIKLGVVTGITVLLYRTLLDSLNGAFELAASLQTHVGATVFYILFAIGMGAIKHRIQTLHPLILGGGVAVVDIVSNVCELVVRRFIHSPYFFQLDDMYLISSIAVLRSYFVVGIYSGILISQMRLVQAEQNKRMEQMIKVSSSLFSEAFYLKKSMNTIENITVYGYDLYRRLKQVKGMEAYSRQALDLSQQIHEVKKDSQRILAGLVKLFDRQTVAVMNPEEVLSYVVKANQEYSKLLGKQIRIDQSVQTDMAIARYNPLITVLNNLVANAVEAIEEDGTVRIRITREGDEAVFVVTDNGIGISEKDRSLIFEPGFTTKYNHEGVGATGIGLSHVRDIVASFEGRIQVETGGSGQGCAFTVSIPVRNLIKENPDLLHVSD